MSLAVATSAAAEAAADRLSVISQTRLVAAAVLDGGRFTGLGHAAAACCVAGSD